MPLTSQSVENALQPVDQVHASPQAKKILRAAVIFAKTITEYAPQTPSVDTALRYTVIAADLVIRSIQTGL